MTLTEKITQYLETTTEPVDEKTIRREIDAPGRVTGQLTFLSRTGVVRKTRFIKPYRYVLATRYKEITGDELPPLETQASQKKENPSPPKPLPPEPSDSLEALLSEIAATRKALTPHLRDYLLRLKEIEKVLQAPSAPS